MLIICTIPLYGICSLIGSKYSKYIRTCWLFIVNTIFVGSIGMLISTNAKPPRVSNYNNIFSSIIYLCWNSYNCLFLFMFSMRNNYMNPDLKMNPIIYLSPVTGFISLLSNQLGGRKQCITFSPNLGIGENTVYISIGVQLVLSVIFLYIASVKLNPLKKRKT